MTVETIAPMTEAEARRITERIRTALDRVANGWADLAERVAEAYERRADLALGYGSWSEYAEAELRPSSAIAAEVRRELVGLLTAQGMSTRAIAPAVGVSPRQAAYDRTASGVQSLHTPQVTTTSTPEPERINPITGEVVPAPTFQPTNVTDWTTEEIDDLMASDDAVIEAWEASTIPAPPKITGLDGKSYSRPKPKEKTMTTAAPPRLAIPQPPKYGGNRLKHNRIIDNTITSAQGLVLVLDEIAELDGSLNAEQAASYADDLSRIIRSLKRIQSLLQKAV